MLPAREHEECVLLLQIRGLSTDLLRLLSQVLRRKAQPLAHCGLAIEYLVSVQRCVCVCVSVCRWAGVLKNAHFLAHVGPVVQTSQ